MSALRFAADVLQMQKHVLDLFSLKDCHIAVLGGQGLLGQVCVETILELEGIPLSIDIKSGADYECDILDSKALHWIANRCQFHGVVNCVVGNQRPADLPLTGWPEDIRAGFDAAAGAHDAFHNSLLHTRGCWLNIGSDLSLKAPDPDRYKPLFKPASYSAVKHAIIGLTRYYALLWAPDIRVNCLCPGSIDQGQAIPACALGRLAQPHEMKGALAWLLSDASTYVTGAVISVDGGSTL